MWLASAMEVMGAVSSSELGAISAGWTTTALLAGALVLLFYNYAPYWSVRRIPGPASIPFLGHLLLLAKYGPDVFPLLTKQYGPIFRSLHSFCLTYRVVSISFLPNRFHLGRQPLVIVADPDLCREVGIKKFKDIPNRSIPSPIASSPLHLKGLFFTRDSRWSAMRNTILSVYQPSHLSSLLPTMSSIINSSMEIFNPTKHHEEEEEEEIVFSDYSLKLATDIIGKAAFGVDFGLSSSHKNEDVSGFINQHIHATTELKMDLSASFSIILGLLLPVLQNPIRQILKRVPGTMDWKINRNNRLLSSRLNDIVTNKLKNKDKDFLSLILSAREEDTASKNIFSDDYVSAVTYEHLLAGSATTAFTLSSIVYLVSAHQEVEKKLLQEIDSFHATDRPPSAHDLQFKFPYLDQVIKESMRFYTVSPLIAREASNQVEIGGYLLPKGTWVWMAVGVLAMDPKNFWEPEKFKPERFDPDCEEAKRRHPYAHIPFGLGPRSCIGQKFSLQEVKLTLIHLYRRYVFRHSPKMESPIQLEYGIVLKFKKGVMIRIIKRA